MVPRVAAGVFADPSPRASIRSDLPRAAMIREASMKHNLLRTWSRTGSASNNQNDGEKYSTR